MSEGNGRTVKFKKQKLPVSFKGYSSGDAVEGLGMSVDLVALSEDKDVAAQNLFRWLASRHIRGKLVLGRRDEGETQGKLYATDIECWGEFDVGRISLSHKNCSFKLSASLEELNGEDLRKFSNREGYFHLESVADEIDTGDDEDSGDADANDSKRPMIAKK